MPNLLTIFKTVGGIFVHRHNNLPETDFVISDFEVSIDGIVFKILELDGATRFKYDIPNITIIDQTGSGTPENYTNQIDIVTRLTSIKYTPFLTDQQQVQTVVWKKNDVIEIAEDLAYITANFDNTGLGINEREGWVVQGWYAGTPQSMGRVGVQWNQADTLFSTIGAIGGNKNVTLVKNNLPPFENWTPSVSGGDADYQPAGPPFSLRKEQIGASLPFSILQPYIVVLKIQRLYDSVVYGNGSVVVQKQRTMTEVNGDDTFALSDTNSIWYNGAGSPVSYTLDDTVGFVKDDVIEAYNSSTEEMHILSASGLIFIGSINYTDILIPQGCRISLHRIDAENWYATIYGQYTNIENDFLNDAAAAAGGVGIGQSYHTAGIQKIRRA